MSENKDKSSKRPYEKPQLRVINLAAEEVLSTGCKTAPAAPGVSGSGCVISFCSSSAGS
jgi:hypothetical protein